MFEDCLITSDLGVSYSVGGNGWSQIGQTELELEFFDENMCFLKVALPSEPKIL